MNARRMMILAALLGLLAVAAGAFGGHALRGDPRAAGLFEIASRYQMWHALAVLLVNATALAASLATALWITGILLFSGSLYALALGADPRVGLLTPLGGLLLLAGWLALAVRLWRQPPPAG